MFSENIRQLTAVVTFDDYSVKPKTVELTNWLRALLIKSFKMQSVAKRNWETDKKIQITTDPCYQYASVKYIFLKRKGFNSWQENLFIYTTRLLSFAASDWTVYTINVYFFLQLYTFYKILLPSNTL